MTSETWLTAVEPTPLGSIRAVATHIDAIERELWAVWQALATAEAILIPAKRPPDAEPDALTTEQVARRLGLSRSTVTAMIGRKELTSVKIGSSRRILRRDLDAYLTRNVRGARADRCPWGGSLCGFGCAVWV